jgi:hypothetical protein
MTKRSVTQKSGSYSKQLTAWSLIAIFAIAAFGMVYQVPNLSEILTVLGSVSLSHNVLYRTVNHMDFKQVLASELLASKKGPPNA